MMIQSAAGHCRHYLHGPPPFFTAYFPHGLKLLLVGVDEATKTKVQKYLPRPYYDIDTLYSVQDGLKHLQNEGKDSYDMVLSEVGPEDKDGYPFIREVQRSCSNIAHVAICESETSSNQILRAYKSGACSVLWKPVSQVRDEIINLWRHVCWMKEQRKASETPGTHLCDVEHMRREQHETSETDLNNSAGVYHGDYIQQNRSVPLVQQNRVFQDQFLNHGTESPPRKRRVVWSGPLQQCFLEAVNELGGPDKAMPKPILEKIQAKMHAPDLTRENIGSHLQKLRQQHNRELHASISLSEHDYDNHSLANLPMQTQIQQSEENVNSFGHVATWSTVPSSSLVGNGSNNLTSVIEELNLTSDSFRIPSSIEELNLPSDSSRIPASCTYVTTTRVNPQIHNSFVSSTLQPRRIGVESNIPQPQQNQNSIIYHLDRCVRGPNNEGIQAMDTSFASNTGAQQLGRNVASGSSSQVSTNYNGMINENRALGTSLGTNMQELSNMMQTPPNLTSSMEQLHQNPSSGSGIINQNPSSGSGMINQNEAEYFFPQMIPLQLINENWTSGTQT